jgi:hypothetical protein
VDGDNSGKCDSYDFNYHNPFLSVNSDCSGGDTIVNANRDILGTWEKFMVYFVDNDNNSYLSRGDQFKLVTFNPDVSLGNKVIRAGEDMSATFLKNLRPVNAQGKGEELLLTLCDNNKNCSSGSGSFLNMNNKANTVCFLSTIKDKSDTWYGYLYDDGGQPRHFPLLGEYYKNDLPSAQAEVCNHHFYIDWLP